MTDEFEGLENLMPDRIPDWLVEQVRRSKGRDLSKYANLGEFFKETQVVADDKFDRAHYKSMRNQADELNSLAMKRFVDDPTWFELVQDEYLGLYKPQPNVRKEADMKPTHRINHATMSKAMGLRDWEQLRTYTELDQWAAAMAAVEFGLKLADLFDEMKELQEAQKNLSASDARIQEIIEQLKDPEGTIEDAEDLLDRLEGELEEYGDSWGNVESELKRNSNEIRQAVKKATQEAHDDAQNVMDMIESFGTEPGVLQRMPAEARLELARRIQRNRKLKELAEKVGRFVRLALGEQARKIVHGTDEIHDVTLGNDVNRILPSELMYLTNNVLKSEFYRKFVEKELLQYELRGTERVARGAIICMIDSSGSMMGSKETWAKAVAIALLNIASKQNRDFHGIIFSSAHQMIEFEFEKGKASPNDVLDFAEYSFMGGTDFMTPINRAIEVLERQYNDEGSQKGDLVMITDGIAPLAPEWLDRYTNVKEQLAFRFYGCLIGSPARSLDVLSDQIYHISELAQGDDVRDMFGFV